MTEQPPHTIPDTNGLRSPSTLLSVPPLPPLNTKVRYVGMICLRRPARSGESEGDRYNRYVEI